MSAVRFDDCRELVFREASRQAHRLARRYDLQPADRDDAFQEIVFDAWRRLKDYRASRGELVAFLGVVTLNQARRIEARLRRRRRTVDVSLDTPIANGSNDAGLIVSDSFSEEHGLPALLGNKVDGHARVEMLIDLSRAIVSLPSEMRRLCACLAHETPGVARHVCNLSNTGMYRQIEALRLHLLAFGFGTL
jgi:DNA-directed RNA polymerase specialized sigma24 family protein